ncbi:MAG: KpsF/GutQ family sugar-phosphate isomerase, partial [Luteitalea sp.]|nr:KpsF/GutQ family sugar-phosphate isomerase [Luteitalea sp.]
MPHSTAASDLELATRVLRIEGNAILRLVDRLNSQFERAVQLILDCRGRIIVTGMGKSGIIARKIAATLASTGTPAFFLHAAEAFHGDLGVIRVDDVVVALSHSGETDEVVRLLETIRRVGARFIVVTGSPDSALGQSADVTLDCGVDEEACPMNLAPTASTTAALALGDALAMVVLVRRGFREEDFANLHPGGQLAKRLMRVARLMHTGERVPHVVPETPIRDVVYEISRKSLGMVCVLDSARRLAGIITDGDLRRHMARMPDILDRMAADVMTRSPITIRGSMLAVEALKLLEERKITVLVVIDDHQRVEGVLHLHDLWRTEMF